MMRVLFPVAGLVIAALSILLDFQQVSPNSWLCRSGFCRFDQLFSAIDAQGMRPSDVSTLVNEDPANPLVWCTYAELLSARGQIAEATAGFEHAVSLGPGMSPVLMRAANFDFSHGRAEHGFQMANRILQQTDAFDQILFSYLTHSGVGTSTLLGTAVPATARAARSWLACLRAYGSDQDLQQTWSWIRQNGLADQKSAVDLIWTLWQRKSFHSAQDVWADWLGPSRDDYLHPQRLANARFQDDPNGSPFDWTLSALPSVEISRRDGLDVRFSGKENVDFTQVHQFATVNPGRYRFSVEISAEEISTDQGPFFQVFDPVNPARLSVQSPQVKGTVSKSWVTVDFQVPAGTQALQVQLERHPSQRFDNKIAGKLHIYQISLVPLPLRTAVPKSPRVPF
jgi:tetratricopeptide (TPR) repeat protein